MSNQPGSGNDYYSAMKSKFHPSIFILFLIIYAPVMAQHDAILFTNMDSLTGTTIGKINAITQIQMGLCGLPETERTVSIVMTEAH